MARPGSRSRSGSGAPDGGIVIESGMRLMARSVSGSRSGSGAPDGAIGVVIGFGGGSSVPVIPSSDTNVNHIERRRNNMQDIIDQLAVIRVQLDELEKEIRGMMTPKEEEKPPVTMADVRRLMAEKWNLGKRDEVRSLLAAYGAQKLTDVSPGHYEELAEKIEAL